MRNDVSPHIAVAPMMDWTDRHCRYFLRLIAPHVHLYTEMITTGAIIYGDRDRFLRFNQSEHPVSAQLGGADPGDLAACARMVEDYGYDEVNLNCGCPSDRVQNGNFGACLMEDPALVAKAVEAMTKAVDIPVSVKCRIAIDNHEEEPFLDKFIGTVSQAGCVHFIVHARKAWLQGLNPKQNREIPELRYDIVRKMKQKYPHLQIILNGGIGSMEDVTTCLSIFDGSMLGRKAYKDPYFLTEIERDIFGNHAILPRETVARAMIPYIGQQQKDYGTPVNTVTRHMLGLFQGQRGARIWRQTLSDEAVKEGVTAYIIEEALSRMQEAGELVKAA
jgi:tRNA-dihydrouridine synthase A